MSTELQDKETLVSIVNEMAKSFSGAQSTKHWAENALWFDIPPFASRGIEPALKMFDSVFNNLKSCDATILEIETFMSDDMGIVCSVQKLEVVFKNDTAKTLWVRQTDCFKKSNTGEWKLIHQHCSVPMGNEWDGKIVAE